MQEGRFVCLLADRLMADAATTTPLSWSFQFQLLRCLAWCAFHFSGRDVAIRDTRIPIEKNLRAFFELKMTAVTRFWGFFPLLSLHFFSPFLP